VSTEASYNIIAEALPEMNDKPMKVVSTIIPQRDENAYAARYILDL
jgi:hypothetical protein